MCLDLKQKQIYVGMNDEMKCWMKEMLDEREEKICQLQEQSCKGKEVRNSKYLSKVGYNDVCW